MEKRLLKSSSKVQWMTCSQRGGAKQGTTKSQKPTRKQPSFSLQPQTPEAAFVVGGDNLATAFLGIPVKQDHTVESLLCEIC